ncbi:hypothetical protein BJ170DRAFT_730563 [Xylariales sp. AK1849]|nr:hypothetical protein BJ170DRAFT_730563 [Xylariales sp. AK1849]
MADTLRIALEAGQPLDTLVYHFHDQQYDDEDYALKMTPRIYDLHENRALQDQTARRINGYCRGLLQEHGGRMEFLHRTVANFLKTREISDIIVAKSASRFHPPTSILRAYLALLKSHDFQLPPQNAPSTLSGGGNTKEPLDNLLDNVMATAHLLDEEEDEFAKSTGFDVITEMELYICRSASGDSQDLRDTRNNVVSVSAVRRYFRTAVLEYGLVDYLAVKLRGEPDHFDDFATPALCTLMLGFESSADQSQAKCSEARLMKRMRVLLEAGCDPNERVGLVGESPWTTLISHITKRNDSLSVVSRLTDLEIQDKFLRYLENDVMLLFLQYGADPNASVSHSGRRYDQARSSAWLNLLIAGVQIPLNKQHKAAILEVLDALLGQKANLTASVQSYEKALRPDESCVLLRDRGDIPQSRTPEDTQFLAEVVMRILLNARDVEWPMEPIWRSLSSEFSSRQLGRMQTRYYDAIGGSIPTTSDTASKRSCEDGLVTERSSKAPRLS